MLSKFLAFILASFLSSQASWAHGGNEPGPHGGLIEMPGAYHVEVIRTNPKTFLIYLIDIDFKNPVTENSSVKARILGGKNIDLDCKVDTKERFQCSTDTNLRKKEVLIIESNRSGIKGNEAKFELKK